MTDEWSWDRPQGLMRVTPVEVPDHVDCRAYSVHQSAHRWVVDRFRCSICEPDIPHGMTRLPLDAQAVPG